MLHKCKQILAGSQKKSPFITHNPSSSYNRIYFNKGNGSFNCSNFALAQGDEEEGEEATEEEEKEEREEEEKEEREEVQNARVISLRFPLSDLRI